MDSEKNDSWFQVSLVSLASPNTRKRYIAFLRKKCTIFHDLKCRWCIHGIPIALRTLPRNPERWPATGNAPRTLRAFPRAALSMSCFQMLDVSKSKGAVNGWRWKIADGTLSCCNFKIQDVGKSMIEHWNEGCPISDRPVCSMLWNMARHHQP